MRLTYRGNAYEIPDPIQPGFDSGSGFADQFNIKLTYRGRTYYTTPRPLVVSEAVESNKQTVLLIYRGNIYEQKLYLPEPYQTSRASNWRWQF